MTSAHGSTWPVAAGAELAAAELAGAELAGPELAAAALVVAAAAALVPLAGGAEVADEEPL